MEYVGRMVCDGNGNLLADEGEQAGDPIAYDENTDTFVFIGPDEPSHNERHHLQFAQTTPTQSDDPDFPGYAGEDAENATEGNEHHFSTGATEELGIKQLPDKQARLTGGHTNQHKVGA
jgi:hypothetical protein